MLCAMFLVGSPKAASFRAPADASVALVNDNAHFDRWMHWIGAARRRSSFESKSMQLQRRDACVRFEPVK